MGTDWFETSETASEAVHTVIRAALEYAVARGMDPEDELTREALVELTRKALDGLWGALEDATGDLTECAHPESELVQVPVDDDHPCGGVHCRACDRVLGE